MRIPQPIAILVSSAPILCGQSLQNPEDLVRDVIAKFADARNAHDGKAAAEMYFDDGEYISAGPQGTIRGRAALAKLWGLGGNVPRTVMQVQILTPNIAIATVEAHFTGDFGTAIGIETFLLIKDEGQWRIRVHQRIN